MYKVNQLSQIDLGRQGENKATTVEIDVSKWLAEYPNADINIVALRNTDTAPYIASTTVEDNILKWVITASDTQFYGRGKAEIRATVDDVVKKSAIAITYVSESLEGEPSPEPPEPSQSWVDEVIAAKESIEDMSATADVDNNVGTPSVTVTKSIIDDHINLDFSFKNLKGEKGDKADVDEHYNPSSEKAQSGIAVSEAVSPKADKTYVDEQLGGKADKENTYTKSETQEYVSSATANFITATANNLINYYLKSEIYTKNEVQNLIGQIQTAHFEVVQELPQTGESNVIYLILRSDPETSNIYDEYIYINNAYEKIGSTDVDLTGYATESWVNQQIADFLTQTQIQSLINTALTNYYTKTEISALLNTKADKYNPIDYISYIKENDNTTITITATTETNRRNLVGEITIPAFIEGLPVTKLDSSAFAYCTRITRIYLPDTLTTINDRAFQGCSALEYVNIPDNVTWLGIRAFQACPLVDITLPLNMRFEGQAVFIALETQAHLERAVIKSAVTSLPTELFSGQSKLESVYIPETVTTIGASAFLNCNSLADVYFGGTQAQWNAITIGGNNTALSTATIHYNQRPAIMQDVLDNSSPIKSISQNGTPITPDSSGNVNITGGGGGTVDQTYDPTSTNAQSGTAVAEAVEDKLTEPSSGLAVGKYFRVASIDADGHAVLECVDAPTAPVQSIERVINVAGTYEEILPDVNGVVKLPFATTVGAAGLLSIVTNDEGFTLKNNRYLKLNSPLSYLQQRYTQFAVLGNNYDTCVKWAMTDGRGAAWTDAERLAALLRMGCTVDENGYVKWTAQS